MTQSIERGLGNRGRRITNSIRSAVRRAGSPGDEKALQQDSYSGEVEAEVIGREKFD